MKIGEAQQIYRQQVQSYRKESEAVSKQLAQVQTKMKYASKEDREHYKSEAATLELTLEALDDQKSEYEAYLERLSEQYCAHWNKVADQQQKEAAKQYARDLGKIMEVARRIMRGDIVPASDEKKLMDFNREMYQTAKDIGAMVQREKRKKYDSLWGDEETKESEDPKEAAQNAHAGSEGPQIVDAADTIASVPGASLQESNSTD
ncbi:MAG: hypothetical protein HFH35_12750 [Eubacterium sp.]|nr:hypothetical protein [Eubacterium sp.]